MPAVDSLDAFVDETHGAVIAAPSTRRLPALRLVRELCAQGATGGAGSSAACVIGSDVEAARTVRTPELRAAAMERNRRSYAYRLLKRAFDVALSLVVLVVALVPGLALGAVIALQSKGSPIYVDRRVGRGGRPLGVLKFRSMVCDADDVGRYLDAAQLAQWRSERKVEGDPRVTPVGRVIRRLSLDELPQFLNVLAGQMSVVGPRPVTPGELGQYGEDGELFVSMRPGITGWWQVTARNGATYESGERQQLELYYVEHASLGLDARVLCRTLGAMRNGTGC